MAVGHVGGSAILAFSSFVFFFFLILKIKLKKKITILMGQNGVF
jgi:hypothetical protein